MLGLGQVHHVVINELKNNPNEPTIAINPFNSGDIVAAANINNVYHSKDSGKTWSHTFATSEFGVYGDPVLHFARKELFYTHLSRTPGKAYGDWFDRIVVQKIESIEPWIEQSYSVGYNNNKMQDKPWLSSDEVSEKFNGNAYVTWTEFDKYNSSNVEDRSRIRFSRYTPNTNSFSDGITISDTTGDCLDGDNTLEGATTAIGKNGDIYAVWAGHNKIYFDKSFDGGITWNKDQIIAEQPEGWDMALPNIFRANGMPFIQCDTKRNIIYVCWADEFNGNADVWLKYSSDQGRTWSDRICLNLDNTNSHQYFPNMAINKTTGEVIVAFYDQRHSSLNVFYDIYVASFAVDSTVKNYRITAQSIPLPGSNFFYGDYVDVAIQNDLLAVAYPTFSLNYLSNIEVGLVSNFPNQYKEPALKQNGINVLKGKDSCAIYVNEQHPYSLKLKIKKGRFFGVEKEVIIVKKEQVKKNQDILIGAFEWTTYDRLKYKLINLENKHKMKYKF